MNGADWRESAAINTKPVVSAKNFAHPFASEANRLLRSQFRSENCDRPNDVYWSGLVALWELSTDLTAGLVDIDRPAES